MDMYSSGLTDTYPASRIRSIGGDATLNNGTLQLESGTINITPIGNTTIGSATSVNTFIKNTDSLVVGTNPSSLISSNATIAGTDMRFYNVNTASYFDLYSSRLSTQNSPSSRIYSIGGTSGINTGDLTISSGTIAITPVNNLTLGTNTNLNRIGKLNISGNELDTAVMLDDLNIGISNAGKLNIGGQSPTVFGGKTQIKGSVIDLFSAGTLTIGSANTTSISIGSTSSVNNYLTQIDSLLMGQTPSTYNINTGKMNGLGMRF